MNDPVRQLRLLPWRSLIQAAVLALIGFGVVEFLLVLGNSQSAAIHQTLLFLFSPPLDLLTLATAGLGIGALAVYLLETLSRQILIYTPTLWAVILCLILCLLLKSFLPLPAVLVSFNETQLIGLIVGVFWKGRRYWR
jgi:hypothetical protein